MRKSNAIEKLLNSCINTTLVLIIFIPFNFFIDDIFYKKLTLVALFFFCNLFFLFFQQKLLGMVLLKMEFEKKYKNIQYLAYSFLYSISFSTLLFTLFFPFDVFIFNAIFIQYPMIKITGTTLHGFLAGKITTHTDNERILFLDKKLVLTKNKRH